MRLSTMFAGSSFSWETVLTDYTPADGWLLKYRLAPVQAGSVIEFAAGGDALVHNVVLAATVTALWTPGLYGWSSWVERDTSSIVIESGRVEIKPDPRTVTVAVETRTAAQVALAQAEAALEQWTASAGKIRRYKIAGRETEFNNSYDLLEVIKYWRKVVQDELAQSDPTSVQSKFSRRLHTRFTR